MMNIDQARAGEGIVSPAKPEKKKESETPGVTEPVFSSQEQKLNIEVPSGWKVVES